MNGVCWNLSYQTILPGNRRTIFAEHCMAAMALPIFFCCLPNCIIFCQICRGHRLCGGPGPVTVPAVLLYMFSLPEKNDVMSCNSWFVKRFLCLCQFSFPTTRFVRLELFMRSVRMHFVKNQVKQQNWFTHHNRKKLSGCISHEPLATAAVLLFSPCHESLSKFRDEPLCVFVMFVVVQR